MAGLILPVLRRDCCCCCGPKVKKAASAPGAPGGDGGSADERKVADDVPVYVVYHPIERLYFGNAGWEPNIKAAHDNFQNLVQVYRLQGYNGPISADIFSDDTQRFLIEPERA